MVLFIHSFQFPDKNEVCIWLGAGEKCEEAVGYTAVYRLGLAITVYHFLLMLITCGECFFLQFFLF